MYSRQLSIHTLPVELLSYIFVLGTHESESLDSRLDSDHDDDCQPFNSESVQAPLTYTAVCRHWRNVALNTPALFTSLCITPELLRDVEGTQAQTLDMSGISAYLGLSRNYSLDILIDARDQDWDFDDNGVYSPWFSAEHMRTAMCLLLPHISRWRSLSILTDVSAPMCAALRLLDGQLGLPSSVGAPRLESLRLMRCDAYAAYADADTDFVSTSPYAFLSGLNTGATRQHPFFPSLRTLTLRGVSASWTALSSLLAPSSSLRTLELAFLPTYSQPTALDLTALLSTTPNLARLTLNAAGPRSPRDPGSETGIMEHAPLSLPYLNSFALGYTSARGGMRTLRLLAAGTSSAAPHLRDVVLEDASDPAALDAVDAAPLVAGFLSASGLPAIQRLTLKRTHVATPLSLSPPTAPRLARLELVGASAALLSLARAGLAEEVCVRGPLAPAPACTGRTDSEPYGAAHLHRPREGWMEGTARALLSGSSTPLRLVEVHEAAHPSFESDSNREDTETEEYIAGGTCVRLVRCGVLACDEDAEMSGGSDSDSQSDGGSQSEGEDATAHVPTFSAQYIPVRVAGLSQLSMVDVLARAVMPLRVGA